MIFITGPEGSGHHLLQDIYETIRCHGYFFASLPSNRDPMPKLVWHKVGKNTDAGTFVPLNFLTVCETSQVLFLHREPYGCIYSAWKRFGNGRYDMIPTFVSYYAMAITLQKSMSYLYRGNCAVWYYDKFVEEHLGTEIDGVLIKRREHTWETDLEFIAAMKPYDQLLNEIDTEWMKKLPTQHAV